MNPQEKVRAYWNSFVEPYAKLDQNLAVIGLTVLNFLKIQPTDKIFEAGCGTGKNTAEILRMSPNSLVAVDLSDEMVKYTQGHLQAQKNLQIWQADIENLEQFESGSFDIYFSNLVFHITTHPEKALKEAYRILKANGRFGISVWGLKNRMDFIALRDLMIEVGYNMPAGHDQFKFGSDREQVRQQLEQIGFKNTLIWYQTVAMDRLSIEEYFDCQNPLLIETIKSEPDLEAKLMVKLKEFFYNKFEVQHEPLYFDAMIVVARK